MMMVLYIKNCNRRMTMRLIRCHSRPMCFASGLEATTGKVRARFEIKQKLNYGHKMAVVGSSEELGTWDPLHAHSLSWNEDDLWQGETEVPRTVEFKFVVLGDGEVVSWQPGDNVCLDVPAQAEVIHIRSTSFEDPEALSLTVIEGNTKSDVRNINAFTEAVSSTVLSEPETPTSETLQSGTRESTLNGLKVAELKQMCKERGLPVSGRKADLVARLMNE